jgi:hypothetical protein
VWLEEEEEDAAGCMGSVEGACDRPLRVARPDDEEDDAAALGGGAEDDDGGA